MKLRERLSKACTLLGLEIDIAFKAKLPSGHVISTVARISKLGAPKGMLIVTSFDDVREASDELTSAGYGYSVMSEPPSDESFDLDAYVDVFSDWGWSGEDTERPLWFLVENQ